MAEPTGRDRLIGEDRFREVAEAALVARGRRRASRCWRSTSGPASRGSRTARSTSRRRARTRGSACASSARHGRRRGLERLQPRGAAAAAARSAKELADVARARSAVAGARPAGLLPAARTLRRGDGRGRPRDAGRGGRRARRPVVPRTRRGGRLRDARGRGRDREHRRTALLGAVDAGLAHDGDQRRRRRRLRRADPPERRRDRRRGDRQRAPPTSPCARSDPRPVDPGTYTVVLEPSATSTIVGFLAWIGFAGRDYIEGRSCFSGKAGTQVAAPVGVDLRRRDGPGDDRHRVRLRRHASRPSRPDPRRRVPRRRLRPQHGEAGRDVAGGSTGHGLPPPNPEGPFPLNLCMATGDATVEDMIASTERGLLVTRFHYANVVNPIESTITGMTRDGLFLIEGGEVVAARAEPPLHAVGDRRAVGRLDDRARRGALQRVLLQRVARAGGEDRRVPLLRRQRPLTPRQASHGFSNR